MSEKLVKDGSENKRARMNMMTANMFMEFMVFVIKGNSPEYIDEQGFLHEILPSFRSDICFF